MAASLLTTGCLCEHIKSETITVTSTLDLTAGGPPGQQPSANTAIPPPQPLPTLSSPPAPFITPLPTASSPTGELFLTIAVAQAAIAEFAGINAPSGIITIQPANAVASPQAATPAPSVPEPTGTFAAASATSSQGQTDANPPPEVQGPTQEESTDPAQDGFPGGNPPNATVDLPLTILFLIMYASGAATHISIYRANAKRGHKFLLSDLMFDFCMVRTVTTIFRIIWIFIHPRGVVLAAQIFFNGG